MKRISIYDKDFYEKIDKDFYLTFPVEGNGDKLKEFKKDYEFKPYMFNINLHIKQNEDKFVVNANDNENKFHVYIALCALALEYKLTKISFVN